MRPLYESVKEDKSKADKMFEELGYIEHFKYVENEGYINTETYRTDSSHCMGRSIIFQYVNKRILMPQVITMQELQAINKKCKELRVDIMCKYCETPPEVELKCSLILHGKHYID